MLIQVTAEHIARGVRGDRERCPVGLSMHAMGCEDITVGGIAITWRKGNRSFIAFVPREACEFMLAFDLQEPVQSFTFLVEPEEGL